MIDLMLADLPRVEYGKERITQADIEDAKIRQKRMKERIKREGCIGANLKNLVSNNSSFLQSKAKGD